MKRRIATGIDIGSHHIKVCVIEEVVSKEGVHIRVLGTGIVESSGLKNGYVVDRTDVTERIMIAKRQVEELVRMPITQGFLSVGGISLDETRATGSTVISRADQEITELDLEQVAESARTAAAPHFLNRHILHEIPVTFRLDGEVVLGEARGMKGVRLEAEYLFVTCLKSHYTNIIECVTSAGIQVLDTMASPLAGSYVTLSREQKMKGCLLANIGAETVSIVVYDEGRPISVKVFPVGSSHITDDLALSFKIPLEDAERIKLGRLTGAMYSRKKIDDIVALRFKIMFDLVDKHLKAIGRKGSLPAGIIFSGGGSGSGAIIDIAKSTLSLPAKIGDIQFSPDTRIKDATWAVAYGLALWGLTGDVEHKKAGPFEQLSRSLSAFVKQFLP